MIPANKINQSSPLIGKSVRIVELDQVGTVHTVLRSGQVAEVQVNTPHGPKIIETLQYTIVIIGLAGKLIDLLAGIWEKIRLKIFSKKSDQ